ncbi:hypothetical protein VE02_02267 [Pseudogymnoascus sp. 03VT05]|nr:hypothetical protein VE02_02267 [Pseudogymnoascus sp. 03VT05]
MASMFLRPMLRPNTLGVGLGLSMSTFAVFRQRPMKLDSKRLFSETQQTAAHKPSKGNAFISPSSVKQISSGSVFGLCAGLAVSTFSRPLALLLGLLVVGIQWAASYGIHVLPYGKLRRYVTNVDLKSALKSNVAFKLSFGMTFAMAAFMHF